MLGGLAAVIGGLLLLPAAWSVSAAANPSLNATLPQAGPQQGASGRTFGSAAFDDGTDSLASWLSAKADGTTWQLVVPNSQSASRLIAQYDLSVMSLGGFLGRDDTISVSGFADLVAAGDVRYVQVSGGGGGGPGRRGGFGGGGASLRRGRRTAGVRAERRARGGSAIVYLRHGPDAAGVVSRRDLRLRRESIGAA